MPVTAEYETGVEYEDYTQADHEDSDPPAFSLEERVAQLEEQMTILAMVGAMDQALWEKADERFKTLEALVKTLEAGLAITATATTDLRYHLHHD